MFRIFLFSTLVLGSVIAILLSPLGAGMKALLTIGIVLVAGLLIEPAGGVRKSRRKSGGSSPSGTGKPEQKQEGASRTDSGRNNRNFDDTYDGDTATGCGIIAAGATGLAAEDPAYPKVYKPESQLEDEERAAEDPGTFDYGDDDGDRAGLSDGGESDGIG